MREGCTRLAQGPAPHRHGSESLLPARPLPHGASHLLEPPAQYVRSPGLLNPGRGPENASLFTHTGDQVSEEEGLTPRTVKTRDPPSPSSPLPSYLPFPSPIPPLPPEGFSLCTSCPRRGRKNGALGFVGGGQPEGPAGTTSVPRSLLFDQRQCDRALRPPFPCQHNLPAPWRPE